VREGGTCHFPDGANLAVIILDITLERTEIPERLCENWRRKISGLNRSMTGARRTRP